MSLTAARLIAAVCLILLTIAPAPVAAQAWPSGRDAVALANVNIRDSIPIGPFSGSRVLDVVPAGEQVTVLEERDILTFTRTDRWLQVQRYGSGMIGWVYNGIAGDPPYFVPAQ